MTSITDSSRHELCLNGLWRSKSDADPDRPRGDRPLGEQVGV